MTKIRKAAVVLTLSGALVTSLAAPVYAADDDPWDCNGTVDVACYYYDRYGRRLWCTLWINRCVVG